jgi:MoaA/NifB/PqqE/SkfB family radical SAM enzyme
MASPTSPQAPDLLRSKVQGLIIEVTSKCNLRCTYCTKAYKPYDDLPFVNTDLTDESLRNLHEFCVRNSVKDVALSGIGETAMFEGWGTRIAMFLDDPRINVYLVSNFTRPFVSSDLEALCKVNVVQVSFDSADAEMVRKMRSKARLAIIVDNIRKVRRAIADAGHGPQVLVNCTLTRENIGHIAPLAALCRSLGVDRLLVGEMMVNNPDAELQPLGELPDHLLTALAADLAGAKAVLGDSLGLQHGLEKKMAHASAPKSPCAQPWDTPFIRSDGKVFPCCCYHDHFAPVGDLTRDSLADIWEGPAIREVRAAVLNGTSALPCAECTLAGTMTQEEFAADIAGRLATAVRPR